MGGSETSGSVNESSYDGNGKSKLNLEEQQKLNHPNYFRNGNLQRVRSWYWTRQVILLTGKMK